EFVKKEREIAELKNKGKKKCNKCLKILDENESNFLKYTNRNGEFRFMATCRKCRKNYYDEYSSRPTVMARIKENRANHYKENRDRSLEMSKKYYSENYEKIKKKSKEWNLKNKDRISELAKEWKRNNEEKWNEYRRKYHKDRSNSDPIFKMISRIRNRLYKAFKNDGYTKRSKTFDLVGCSYEDLKNHIESKFKDGMTWSNIDKWEIDHIIPLSSANSLEELEALSHYTNLQPLWDHDNLEKRDKYDPKDKKIFMDWYKNEIKKI
ncbi:MAG: hypothetical protein CMC80_06945, partial [Flavobacteriaceae bacterium]|nr:hypothetical protein [Flavobacteriaceae bacterium]